MRKDCKGVKEIAQKALSARLERALKAYSWAPTNFGCEPSVLGIHNAWFQLRIQARGGQNYSHPPFMTAILVIKIWL